jgi:TRAP-type C4-dicarboxylate transport system permease small subunit
MKPANAFQVWWERVVRLLEWAVIGIFAALVLVVLWGVISRYLPGVRPSAWTEELAIYLLVWLTLLGAAVGFRSHAHLGVDYFVRKLDPRAAKIAVIFGELVIFAFAAFALAYGGWLLVQETLSTHQTTPVLGLPVGWFYLAAPISGFFICAFTLEHLSQQARRSSPWEPSAPSEDETGHYSAQI